MKKLMSYFSHKRKGFILCIFSILVFAGIWLSKFNSYEKYVKICDTLLKDELSQDSISLHFTLTNPHKYHISTSEVVFPSLKKEDRIENNVRLEEYLNSLSKLPSKDWTYPQQLSKNVVISSISGSLEGDQYIYFSEPFSSSHGIQSQYPLLLFEYAFRNEADVRQYLKLLSVTPDYFQSMVDFQKERLAAGYIFSEDNAISAIKACNNFSSAKDAFLTTFNHKIQTLVEQNLISNQAAKDYSIQNQQLVETIVLPAFTKLGDDILLLKQRGVEEKGLYYKKGGKDYYSYLLKESVGTDKNHMELRNLLLKDLNSNLESFANILHTKDIESISSINDPLNSMTPNEMMEDIKTRMQKDFYLPDSHNYPYDIMTVDTCLEDYTAPAYYFTPPLDNLMENHIYINKKHTDGEIHLYTTLAHEGFPGHLYQAVSSQNSFQNYNLPMLRGIISYDGYVEGYATYAELYSYKYAKECAKSLGTNADDLYNIYYYDRRIKLCLYSLLDIMIHGEGKNLQEITSFLNKFGIKDATAAKAIYDYILNEPSTYLKYYVGYLEILECQQLAKDNWGDKYSDMAFHKYLLEIGPAPFSIIKQAIRQYG